jgi:hypothetical protein
MGGCGRPGEEHHAAGLNLPRDQLGQAAGGPGNLGEIGPRCLMATSLQVLGHQFGVADDLIQRRAQIVRQRGNSIGLVS